MACFVVPAVEAIAVSVAKKSIEKKEARVCELKPSAGTEAVRTETETSIPFSKKLGWLSKLLWGGTLLLMFEHFWHGELLPFFPFLSNATNPQDAVMMLKEMATAGVLMAVIVTVVWVGMLLVASVIEKKASKELSVPGEQA